MQIKIKTIDLYSVLVFYIQSGVIIQTTYQANVQENLLKARILYCRNTQYRDYQISATTQYKTFAERTCFDVFG